MLSIEFDGLDELIEAVERMGEWTFLNDLSHSFAHKSVHMSVGCFYSDTDPYGHGWAAWKHPPTRPHVKLMIETGALKNSIKAISISSGGFTLGSFGAVGWNGAAHAHYHQESTDIMPARKFIPEDQMPVGWIDEYEFIFFDMVSEFISA